MILMGRVGVVAERVGFSSKPYRKSCESNHLENNSFLLFLLCAVSIVSQVSLVLSSASKKQTPNRHQMTPRLIGIDDFVKNGGGGVLIWARHVNPNPLIWLKSIANVLRPGNFPTRFQGLSSGLEFLARVAVLYYRRYLDFRLQARKRCDALRDMLNRCLLDSVVPSKITATMRGGMHGPRAISMYLALPECICRIAPSQKITQEDKSG